MTYGTGAPSGNGLLSDLISYWKMDEASGNAIDAQGANDLTASGSPPGTGTGIILGARTFFAGGAQQFTHTDNADFSMGDVAFTFSVWVNLDLKDATRGILGKWVAAGSQREYTLRYVTGSDVFTFFVSSNGTAIASVSVSASGVSTGTWHLLIVHHDPVANEIGIQLDNGTIQTASHTTGVFNGTSAFTLGGSDGGAASLFDGLLDEVGFWKGIVLTADQRSELYNSGSGLSYDDFTT